MEPSQSVGSAPLQVVKVLAYWGQAGEPSAVTAAWLAQRVFFLEADEAHARRFKAAGGRFTVAYTDPFRVIPSRHEPLWDTEESAWLHDSSGRRIVRQYPRYGEQHQLNPASVSARRAYRALADGIKRSGAFDFLYLDDTSWDLRNVFYQYSAPAVEVTEAQYQEGVNALLRDLPLPALVSGFSNTDDHLDDVTGNLIFLPYAAGAIDNEGCFSSTAPKDDRGWRFDANTLLRITAAKKYAICHGQSNLQPDASSARLFFLASWWLTFDPQYSVAFANFASPSPLFVFPEYELVPEDPKETAGRNISELRYAGTSLYVRRFGRCLQAGKPLGPCAAVVNPGNAQIAVPASLSRDYHFVLVLDQNNAFQGGRAQWSAATLRSLAPRQAAIMH